MSIAKLGLNIFKKLSNNAVKAWSNKAVRTAVIAGTGLTGITIFAAAEAIKNAKKVKGCEAENDRLQAQLEQNEAAEAQEGTKTISREEVTPTKFDASDTIFYAFSNQPENIHYFTRKGNYGAEQLEINFNTDGSLSGYTRINNSYNCRVKNLEGPFFGSSPDSRERVTFSEYKFYDNTGKMVNHKYEATNKNGDVIFYHSADTDEEEYVKIKRDGSQEVMTVRTDTNGDIVKYDKNHKVVQKKVFKGGDPQDSELDFTVYPRYDKDGDLIKRDTVYNK